MGELVFSNSNCMVTAKLSAEAGNTRFHNNQNHTRPLTEYLSCELFRLCFAVCDLGCPFLTCGPNDKRPASVDCPQTRHARGDHRSRCDPAELCHFQKTFAQG